MTKQILNSPFYSGNTIYGGASAYGRKLVKNAEDANSSRMSIQMKPTNDRSRVKTAGLSKTARKILSVMEQYNTPINDAKKIPITPKRSGILSKYIGATPYMVREKKTYNTGLQVPTVPDLLLMKQKERLQNSTESVRQMANKSKSNLNKEQYKLRNDDNNTKSHSGKMKSNRSSVRQKPDDLDPVCEVNLAKVPLPITTLPKFDLLLKPLLSTNEKNNNIEKTGLQNATKIIPHITKTIDSKKPSVKEKENGKSNTFVFSDPLIISKNVKPNSAINCFKFSEPLCKKQSAMASHKSQIETEEIQISKGFGDQFKSSNKWESSSSSARNLQDNSCLLSQPTEKTKLPDSGFGSIFKPSNSTWECSTCLIRNNIDLDKCQACGVPKVSTQPAVNSTNCFKSSEPAFKIQMAVDSSKTNAIATSKGFGDQFKMSDKWECGACLVRNSQSDKNCVACTTARPDSTPKLLDSGFGNKFKPSSSTWECPTCLIRNSKDLDKCQACETAKMTSQPSQISQSPLISQPSLISQPPLNNFGDQFKPPPSTWECSTCLIRNQKSLHLCQACGSAQPSGTNFSDKVNDKTINMLSASTSSSEVFNKVNASESLTNKASTISNSNKVETPTSTIFKVHKADLPREKTNNSLHEAEFGNSKNVMFGSELKKPENLFGNKTMENPNIFNSVVNTTPSIIFGNPFPTMDNDKLPTTIISDKFSSPKPSIAKVDAATPMFLSNFDSPKQDKPNSLMFKTDFDKINDVVFETELKKSDMFSSRPSETTNFFTASTAAVTNPTFNFNAAPVSTSSTFQFNSSASTSKDTQAPLFKFGSSTIQPPTTTIKPFNGQDVSMSTNLNFSAPATGFNFGNIGKLETPVVASNNIFGQTSNASKNGTFNFGPNANNTTDKAVFTFGASQTGTSQPNPGFAPSNPSIFMFGTQAVSVFKYIYN